MTPLGFHTPYTSLFGGVGSNPIAATICNVVLLFCSLKEKDKLQSEILNKMITFIYKTKQKNHITMWYFLQNFFFQIPRGNFFITPNYSQVIKPFIN